MKIFLDQHGSVGVLDRLIFRSTQHEMSSRAIRRLQKQNEQQGQSPEPVDMVEDERELESPIVQRKVLNAFDLLGDTEEAQDDSDSDEDVNLQKDIRDGGNVEVKANTSSTSAKKKKKKQKRKKKTNDDPMAKNAASVDNKFKSEVEGLDEIDLALKALPTRSAENVPSASAVVPETLYEESLLRLLAVENKHLNAMNEMRRLFGNVALEIRNETTTSRRPQRGGVIHLDLGSALAAQYSPVSRGQGLSGLALRRNVFMNGKEEWPRATSGGLEMKVYTQHRDDGKTEYCFRHNAAYKDVERQFTSCVASMDPQRLIALLTYNPYHISTLLQVSEIAEQQGDHSVCGDLLERTLFTFGRSVHSSFPANLAKGLAHLDFNFFENRELWLATWRYIDNLSQRGTWRTAYEWAKLLLSLDLEGDPYCILLVIDSMAIRGGQAEHFISLIREMRQVFLKAPWPKDDIASLASGDTVEDLVCVDFAKEILRPNLAISSVLARHKVGHDRTACAQLLGLCIRTWPFIFFRLFQELRIEPIPRSIWGRLPTSDRDRFTAESYVQSARDLWDTPDVLTMLKQVANSIPAGEVNGSGHSEEPISIDEARHLLLSSKPSLLGLIPQEYSRVTSSASDPLPPPSSLQYWEESTSETSHFPGTSHASPFDPENLGPRQEADAPPTEYTTRENDDEQRELEGLQSWFSRFWRADSGPSTEEDDTVLDRVADESGVPQEVIMTRQSRLVQLAQRLLGIDATLGPSQVNTSASDTADDNYDIDGAGSAIPGTFPETHVEDLREIDGDRRSPSHGRGAEAAEAFRRMARARGNADESPAETDSDGTSHRITPLPLVPSEFERTKRYLAGAGMLALKDFIAQHGGDMEQWRRESEQVHQDGTALVQTYAAKACTLGERDRKFILDYPLAQGAGQAARELVLRSLDRGKA